MVEKGDYNSISNYVIKLLKDKELCSILGENSYRTFKQNFTIKIESDRVDEVYKNLIEKF